MVLPKLMSGKRQRFECGNKHDNAHGAREAEIPRFGKVDVAITMCVCFGLSRITTITTIFGTTAPHGFGTSGLSGPEVSRLGSWDKGIAVVSDDSGYNSDDGDEFHNGDGDGRDDRGLDGGGVLRRRVAPSNSPRLSYCSICLNLHIVGQSGLEEIFNRDP